MSFRETLLNKMKFSAEEADLSVATFDTINLKKKDFFVEEGMQAKYLGLLVEGLLRRYFINSDGDEVTTQFIEPVSLVLSIESFNKQIKAEENIVALSTCNLLTITLDEWNTLCDQIPKWRQVCQWTGDAVSLELVERSKDLQTLSAADRYHKFCREHPAVYRQATLGQIASFLGIDVATLSRIRKRNPGI